MPYSIRTKDGIVINNIPDDVDRNSDALREKVVSTRAQKEQKKVDSKKVAQCAKVTRLCAALAVPALLCRTLATGSRVFFLT
jgi:hypothetical protein